MNTKILLLALSVASISSCSTAFKTGQTPDDVYFSPARNWDDETNDDRDNAKQENREEREVRMTIRDRRWRTFDNDYSYNPYYYGYNYGYYYNPYYCAYPVYSPGHIILVNPVNSTPRITNLGSYTTGYNNTNTTVNTKTGSVKPVRSYNNKNEESGLGNVIRNVFFNGKNNSNDNSSKDNRTYSPSNNSSSSSGNSSSGTITRPEKTSKN